MSKHKLTLMPSNQVLEIEDGETLFNAFKTNNIYVKTTCGGFGRCGNCKVKILSDPKDCITDPSFNEKQILGNVFHITHERLACQTRLIGDVTVDNSAHEKALEESERIIRSKVTRRKKEEPSSEAPESAETKPAEWFEHWKKEKNPDRRIKTKKLGGNKKPKFFDTAKKPVSSAKKVDETKDFRRIRGPKKD